MLPVCLLFTCPKPLDAQQIKEMQFINQPITDILIGLGQVAGKSIIADETVRGTASYHFTETEFDAALQVFLSTYKLYYRKEEGVYYVSRIKVEYDPPTQTVSLDAEDVDIPFLIRAASKAIGKTILFDPLPAQPLTVHVVRVTPQKLLDIIVKRFSDYQVEADKDYFYIKRSAASAAEAAARRDKVTTTRIEKKGDLYSINVEKDRFLEIIDELFRKAGREYSLLVRKDAIVEKLRFENKDFEQLLRLLLEQASSDYAQIGPVYYIFEIQQRDVLKKFNTTLRIPLVYLSAKELTSLFPAEFLPSQAYKLDLASNSIILSGSLEEIGPAQEFIRRIDNPVEGREYVLFRLNYLNAGKIQPLLPPALRHIEPIVIPDSNSFVALVTPESREILQRYLAMIDKPMASATVRLKYLRAEDLLKKLPPSISKEEVIETGDPAMVFLRTSPEKLEDFYRELRILDKPIPQIRYQLLVIQHNEGEGLNWSNSLKVSPASAGAQSSYIGTLGNLLNLSFDIVSTFGMQFALQLNLDLSTNRARILADTALVGLTGQEINFQNTDTFRYQEVEVDEDGNMRFTGVTREITSGLIFKIKGWVSGDEMITMEVKATVSKRGTVTSSTVGSLPPTSENIVNTQARTLAGEPVVIGGLIRQEKSIQITKLPVLGSIPLLGYLFQSRKETFDNSELVIYIVPHVEYSAVDEANVGLKLERLYRQFLLP
jgi:type II secretory pathway component GspD/PulD (secretin)